MHIRANLSAFVVPNVDLSIPFFQPACVAPKPENQSFARISASETLVFW